MKKKIQIIIIVILILILLIAAFFIFKQNKENKYERDPSLYGSWFKEKIEFYANDKMYRSQDTFTDSYINIDRREYQVCFNLNNKATCEHYKYSAKDGHITIYDFMNLEEAHLTYTQTEDGTHLTFKYEEKKYNSYYIDKYQKSSG